MYYVTYVNEITMHLADVSQHINDNEFVYEKPEEVFILACTSKKKTILI